MLQSFFIILMTISINSFITAQDLQITYSCKKKYKIDEILKMEGHKFPEEQKELLLSMKDLHDNYQISFILVQKNFASKFFPKSGTTESVKNETEGGKKSYYMELKDDEVYKEFSSNVLLATKHKHGRTFYIRDSFPNFCWNFTSETKEILGYSCTKATINDYYGDEIIAWFTSTIPIPNGPVEFGGLPGVILELTTKTLKYEAIELHLNQKEEIKITSLKQKEKKVISMAEFFKNTKKVRKFGK
jgi:GLPGLI family protein